MGGVVPLILHPSCCNPVSYIGSSVLQMLKLFLKTRCCILSYCELRFFPRPTVTVVPSSDSAPGLTCAL